MPDLTPNIPLLRKAVEWAEAEAAKPRALCEWEQKSFRLDADGNSYEQGMRTYLGKAPECGTCYCIAGWVAEQVGYDRAIEDESDVAAEALGISPDWSCEDGHLFAASNTIEDVRRIAEDIAGERL